MDLGRIIAVRRDGGKHSQGDLRDLAQGAADGSIPDYQLAAWLMAAYLNPLSEEETAWLTLAMADSGERIDLAGLPKPWVDKHSTGGVGDKTTLVLLPLLAACGLTLVKMSGRGLGVTGGTIDKLSSVPGFQVDLSPDEMKAQAAKIGLAITGQSPNLAPADKALYALRDVTGTTSSIPLLVSSILSKKIAGGAETVVLDVKCGSGAFMHTEKGARDLAEALARTAKLAGLQCRLAITDMSQPLGSAVGNALEVEEARRLLTAPQQVSPATQRLKELCLELAALTLAACGIAADRDDGRKLADSALYDGRAREKAEQWFSAQGGDFYGELPRATRRSVVVAPREGWIRRFDAETVGRTVIDMGGGRHRKDDVLDLTVGVEFAVAVGSRVNTGDALFTVHAATLESELAATTRLLSAIEISPDQVPARDLILSILE